MHPEAESLFRKYQNTFFLKGIIHAFRIASGFLPVWFMRASAVFIVVIFILFNLNNFKAVMTNIQRIRPKNRLIKRIFSAYEMFLFYSFYLIDLFYLSHDDERIHTYRMDIRGKENLKYLFSKEKEQGFILLTLHMGNWEIAGAVLSQSGIIPHVVYSPDTEDTIESHRKAFRKIYKVWDVPLGKGELFSIRLYNILKDGGVVAFQGDRLLGDSGVEMDFFGEKAVFPKGPVVLAMVSKLPILLVFTVMKGYKRYEIFIEEPYTVALYSSRDETIEKALNDIVFVYEKYISQYPEQWFTFMPFWLKDKDTEEQKLNFNHRGTENTEKE
ncbi:MAG: lysophospholipid acyltransferase family protein [Nitrospira sp.]|nr:lysophospholipid acyltransferase family protein [Nitrospira sp.]